MPHGKKAFFVATTRHIELSQVTAPQNHEVTEAISKCRCVLPYSLQRRISEVYVCIVEVNLLRQNMKLKRDFYWGETGFMTA